MHPSQHCRPPCWYLTAAAACSRVPVAACLCPPCRSVIKGFLDERTLAKIKVGAAAAVLSLLVAACMHCQVYLPAYTRAHAMPAQHSSDLIDRQQPASQLEQ